jgi:phenylpyruvate tautomerase PptA (4-oxalocrotonate tautomerase family)
MPAAAPKQLASFVHVRKQDTTATHVRYAHDGEITAGQKLEIAAGIARIHSRFIGAPVTFTQCNRANHVGCASALIAVTDPHLPAVDLAAP